MQMRLDFCPQNLVFSTFPPTDPSNRLNSLILINYTKVFLRSQIPSTFFKFCNIIALLPFNLKMSNITLVHIGLWREPNIKYCPYWAPEVKKYRKILGSFIFTRKCCIFLFPKISFVSECLLVSSLWQRIKFIGVS